MSSSIHYETEYQSFEGDDTWQPCTAIAHGGTYATRHEAQAAIAGETIHEHRVVKVETLTSTTRTPVPPPRAPWKPGEAYRRKDATVTYYVAAIVAGSAVVWWTPANVPPIVGAQVLSDVIPPALQDQYIRVEAGRSLPTNIKVN